ncbi:DUF421 domain-containing protein [Sphingopyxis sp. SE2]|jgi:uncharacterized membrane protein YcaP (DUF421 family)|uniref:DUF421 domain-containing protein n=1 Tax=unclassified Sphingopyxis TaxID=2614943 RepID=UPI00051057FD|nr:MULTISPECIES: DUF421 domain-containing protein [unclassified Sphingopyxis]KGB58698.1 putative membrane protein precursor [Sphingopyxis sp. LC363]MDT7528627.1 DUF421 domain-containing protein [Sphingopyxis sp. SE2]
MDIVLRATVMFFVLFLLIRLLGKRELGQMTPFEFVVLVVLGDLIQQGVTHNDFSLTGATLAICTFAFWALVLSWTAYLVPRAKDLLEGTPRVVVRDGRIVTENLRRDRLTRDEILSEMRLAGIGRLADVAWAILEPQGKMSFIKKDHGGARQQDRDDPAD